MKLSLSLILLLFLVGCSQTSLNDYSSREMQTYGYAFAPPGFYVFCEREPRLCSTDGSEAVVTLTSKRRAQLEEINRSVNRNFEQRDDEPGIVGDIWELPRSGEGDCEDLAIQKKANLLKLGWPASALLLTVATNQGVGHAVLTVRTNEGDLILDNNTDAVKLWRQTGYNYYARQKLNADGGTQWVRISDQSNDVKIDVTGEKT